MFAFSCLPVSMHPSMHPCFQRLNLTLSFIRAEETIDALRNDRASFGSVVAGKSFLWTAYISNVSILLLYAFHLMLTETYAQIFSFSQLSKAFFASVVYRIQQECIYLCIVNNALIRLQMAFLQIGSINTFINKLVGLHFYKLTSWDSHLINKMVH